MEEKLKAVESQLADEEANHRNKELKLESRNNQLTDDETLVLHTQNARNKPIQRVRKVLPHRKSYCISTSLDVINKASASKVATLKKCWRYPEKPPSESNRRSVADGLNFLAVL